ncbi:MAG: cation diffusion facilitator family transporter [Campylobacter sp.]|nr:cation diffusion facilitator family transporter [Campylobacter sp.]
MTCIYGEIIHEPLNDENSHCDKSQIAKSFTHFHFKKACDAKQSYIFNFSNKKPIFHSHENTKHEHESHSHKHLEHNKHSHENAHSHTHKHAHIHKISNQKALLASLSVTLVAMLIQFIYSIITNSLALLSDTLHMATHALALGLSFFAIYIAKHYSHELKSFGYWRAEPIAALINAIFIGLSGVFIIYEAVHKLGSPEAIDTKTMLIVAVFGLCVNIATALIMLKGDLGNLNLRSAFLHMMSDLLSSVAIIISGILVHFTHFYYLDTIIAAIIAALIGKWGYELAKQSINILLEASPLSPKDVKKAMCEVSMVKDAHDLHITQITDKMLVLTAHIVILQEDIKHFAKIVSELKHMLRNKFGISHINIQPEWRQI